MELFISVFSTTKCVFCLIAVVTDIVQKCLLIVLVLIIFDYLVLGKFAMKATACTTLK
jgi:hypothetical protein